MREVEYEQYQFLIVCILVLENNVNYWSDSNRFLHMPSHCILVDITGCILFNIVNSKLSKHYLLK